MLTSAHALSLGDLGRYRMAIEDNEPKDREVWSNVAKFWYNKASDRTPDVGRLYHHLAILARPFSLEQLSLYLRSLICVMPFESTRGSIMTLLNPILHNKDISQRRSYSLEILFITVHALLFTIRLSDAMDQLSNTIKELGENGLFEIYITKTSTKFKENGVFIAIANVAALFEYGVAKDSKSKSTLRIAVEKAQQAREKAAKPAVANSDEAVQSSPSPGPPIPEKKSSITNESNDSALLISWSSKLACQSLATCLRYPRDSNVYPLVHVYLVFFWSIVSVRLTVADFETSPALKILEENIPCRALCDFLNTLAADPESMTPDVWAEVFPRSSKESNRPLPEDYIMRGLIFSQWLFPTDWFVTALVDEEERSDDLPSLALPRKQRMLWLGIRISHVRITRKIVLDCH